MPAPAVIAVLLDAMDEQLARGWAREGRMPALASLLERSAHARTEAPPGFVVGGIWPTFASSLDTGRHGEYCWRQFDPQTYVEKEPTYDGGLGEPFWRTLDRAGRRVLALDVPRTTCVPLERGLALHDVATHDPLPQGPASSPPGIAAALARRFFPSAGDLCDRWPRGSAAEVRAFEARLMRRIEGKERLFEALRDEHGPFDVVVTGFSEAHCAGHHLWHLSDPSHRSHDPSLARELGDPLRRVYERLDAALARVLASAEAGTRTLVLLSHGMGPHYDGVHLLDRLLERLRDDDLPGTRPLTWRERLLRLRAWGRRPKRCGLRRLWRRWPSLRFRPAFTVENGEVWAAVRLNVVGRERHGRIAPASVDQALARVEALLRSARNPGTGQPAFLRVERTASICRGERAGILPDLVAEWSRAGPFDALEIPGLGRVEGRSPAARTGDHRPDGLVLVGGPGLPVGPLGRRVPVHDLAPTLCGWLDVAMVRPDGRPVPEWSRSLVRVR